MRPQRVDTIEKADRCVEAHSPSVRWVSWITPPHKTPQDRRLGISQRRIQIGGGGLLLLPRLTRLLLSKLISIHPFTIRINKEHDKSRPSGTLCCWRVKWTDTTTTDRIKKESDDVTTPFFYQIYTIKQSFVPCGGLITNVERERETVSCVAHI